jgi:hypothetical protein
MSRSPQRCSKTSLTNSNKVTKAIGGIRDEEQNTNTKFFKISIPKIHLQRDDLAWSKCGSRSPQSSSQIDARIIGRGERYQAQ